MPAITPGSIEDTLSKEFMAFKEAMDKSSSAKDKYLFAKQARGKASELIDLGSGNLAHYKKLHAKFVEIIDNYEKERDAPPIMLYGGHPVMLHGGHPVMLHGGHPVMLHDGHPVVLHDGVPVMLHGGYPGWP